MAGRLEALTVLRDALAEAIAAGPSTRDFPALSREYRAVMAEIAELAPVELRGDAVDEISQRRAARRAVSSAGSPRSKRSG